MTDRELLELAARAAGLPFSKGGLNAERLTMDPPNPGLWIRGGNSCWNPLLDDGDALRIAVRLRLKIVHTESAAFCSRRGKVLAFEDHGPDAHRATRRVIVRAAAALAQETQSDE